MAVKHLLYDQAIPLLDIYTRQIKTYVKRRLQKMFIAGLFIFSQTENSPNVHQQETEKQIVVYLFYGILFSNKWDQLLTHAAI